MTNDTNKPGHVRSSAVKSSSNDQPAGESIRDVIDRLADPAAQERTKRSNRRMVITITAGFWLAVCVPTFWFNNGMTWQELAAVVVMVTAVLAGTAWIAYTLLNRLMGVRDYGPVYQAMKNDELNGRPW